MSICLHMVRRPRLPFSSSSDLRCLLAAGMFLALLPRHASAQEPPRWAAQLPDLPARPGFYQGLGSAPSEGNVDAEWQRASGQARSQILQQIRVVIMNKVSTKVTESSSTNGNAIDAAFSSTTDQVTTGTLENLVVERWLDEESNTLYAYAAISRVEVEMKIQEQLRRAVESATVFHGAATRALSVDDAQLALRNMMEAIKQIAFAEIYLGRVVTGDLRGRGEDVPLLPLLETETCALLSKIRVSATGGDEQLAERGRGLPLPFSGAVVYQSPHGPVPLRNTALTASYLAPASGTLSAISRTSEEGQFELTATEIMAGEAVNKVRVSIAMPGIEVLADKLPDAVRCLSDTHADFTFTLRTRTNLSVAMHIVEYNLDARRPKSSVQEEIQRRLVGERYMVIEESRLLGQIEEEKLNMAVRSGNFDAVVNRLSGVADLIVVGLVSTRPRTNPTPGIFFSSGTAVVRAIDARSGQVLASVSLDNEKEGGASYEAAGVRLLRKMGTRIGEELKSAIDGVTK